MTFGLFAIGNALVDQEFFIDDATLIASTVPKGHMQLADETSQNTLVHTLSQHTSPRSQTSGGSAANTAFTFAALGGTSFYACRVGDDTLGHFYLNDLKQAGVETHPKSTSAGQTGTCVVMVTPDGERTMQTCLGTSGALSREQVHLDALLASKLFYIEGYLATSPTAIDAVIELKKHCRQRQIAIALTLSDAAMVQYARNGLDQLIGEGVDLLFCNQEEALQYTNTATVDSAADKLLGIAKLVIITQSEKGALVATTTDRHTVAATHVAHVLNTNGAGDAYAGAFLAAYSQHQSLVDCAAHAGTIAAKVIQTFGARMPVDQYQI